MGPTLNSQDAAVRGAAMPAPARPRARAARIWIVYSTIVATTAAITAAVAAAPWLKANGHPFLALTIYSSFKSACHQIPERSLWVCGAPMAICSRCFSLYVGGLLGLLVVPLVRGIERPAPARTWLFVAAAPAVTDFTLGWLGIVENTFLSRGVTGLLLGAASAFYILPGLVDAAMMLWGPAASQGETHGPES